MIHRNLPKTRLKSADVRVFQKRDIAMVFGIPSHMICVTKKVKYEPKDIAKN